MALQPGEIIDGKYRIIRELGSGSMGAVYEGENVRIRRRVAIKVLLPAVAKKGDVVKRFEREAQAAGRIGSEHIVEVLDLGTLADGGFYMVMEFLEGMTLGDRIKKKGRLEPRELVPIVQQLLYGLEMAHEARIIHRDLKPDNIFLVREHAGQKDFVKILDFGVSKFNPLTDDDGMSMTRTGTVMGTPFYMAPEQAKGSKDVDHRSDLYSVGVILYQAVTGQVPFHAGTFNELIFKIVLEQPPPPESYAPNLDPAFGRLIRRAMSRDPDQRFATSSEFAQALSVWLHTGRTDGEEHPPPPDPGDAELDGMATRVADPDNEAGMDTAVVELQGPGTEIMDPGDAPLAGGTEMMEPTSRRPSPPSRRRPPPRPKTAPLPEVPSAPGTVPMGAAPPSSLDMPGAVPVPNGHDPGQWSNPGASGETPVPPPPGMPGGMTPSEAMQRITDRPLSPGMPTPVGRRSPYYDHGNGYEEEPVAAAGVPRRSNNRAVAWVVGGVIAVGLAAAAAAVVAVEDGAADDTAQAAETTEPSESDTTEVDTEPALDLDEGPLASADEGEEPAADEGEEPADGEREEPAADADAGEDENSDDPPVSTKPSPAPARVASRPPSSSPAPSPPPRPKTAPPPAPSPRPRPKPKTSPKPTPKPTSGRKIKTEL